MGSLSLGTSASQAVDTATEDIYVNLTRKRKKITKKKSPYRGSQGRGHMASASG